jgi:hypothetical protein
MAALRQPRAGGQAYLAVSEDALGGVNTTWMSKNAVSEKLQWVGSITVGIVAGAAAALLVAGFIGVHETSASTVHVTGISQIQQAP